MDNEVVNDPVYADQMTGSLLGIPSISIITDLKNLFDPASGIYVNATGHGLEWERECSAELINPDGTEGFNVNAGLRIRGGWSRKDDFPKHAFRLFFREKYGNDKLRYPLFGDEGVEEFDKIDLRAEQNYAWSNGDPHIIQLSGRFFHAIPSATWDSHIPEAGIIIYTLTGCTGAFFKARKDLKPDMRNHTSGKGGGI